MKNNTKISDQNQVREDQHEAKVLDWINTIGTIVTVILFLILGAFSAIKDTNATEAITEADATTGITIDATEAITETNATTDITTVVTMPDESILVKIARSRVAQSETQATIETVPEKKSARAYWVEDWGLLTGVEHSEGSFSVYADGEKILHGGHLILYKDDAVSYPVVIHRNDAEEIKIIMASKDYTEEYIITETQFVYCRTSCIYVEVK